MVEEIIPDWAKEARCAITVADADCRIIYMNDRARETYRSHGDLIGRNLLDCHSPRSRQIIADILASGGTNAYTIEKQGVHKMIFQSAWSVGGRISGILEISMVIPAPLPHYVRS